MPDPRPQWPKECGLDASAGVTRASLSAGAGATRAKGLATHPTEKRPKNLFVVMEVFMKTKNSMTIPQPADLASSRGWGFHRPKLNLEPRAESRGARRLISAPKCVGKSRDMNMNQPSKETPGHPKALGGLLSRPEALRMLHTEALFSAHLSAEPGPASRKGVGAAMAPAPGRFGRGVLLPLGDQAPCVPHHHGPLEAGALGEMDAGTEGELDLMRGGQGTRGRKGATAGDKRRSARRFLLQHGAALLFVGRVVRKTHRALDRAMPAPSLGSEAKCLPEMAFPWRWAEALI